MSTPRERLVKLLQLTQSPNDAEALAAIRKANAILLANNVDWEKFLEPQIEIREVVRRGQTVYWSTGNGITVRVG